MAPRVSEFPQKQNNFPGQTAKRDQHPQSATAPFLQPPHRPTEEVAILSSPRHRRRTTRSDGVEQRGHPKPQSTGGHHVFPATPVVKMPEPTGGTRHQPPAKGR